jgi:hypothetical protein
MLKSRLHPLVMACAILAWAQTSSAQPDPNGRPTRPPGWEYRPSPGNEAPAFAFDPCPGCSYHDSAYLVMRCEVGKSPAMTLNPADQGGRLTRLENQTVTMDLTIDGVRHRFRMQVDVGPNGPIMETAVPSEHPIFQALADGSRLVLSGPGGAIAMPLTRSGEAIRRWADACNAQVAAPAPRAGPAAPMAALGPTSSPSGAPSPAPKPAAPAASAPAGPAVPEATLRARLAAYLARNYEGMPRHGYTAQFVDLNGDGIAEVLLSLNYDSGQCGAANCGFEILDLTGPSARALFGGFAPDAGMRALDSRTQGWRDVRLDIGQVLRWRNGEYHWPR